MLTSRVRKVLVQQSKDGASQTWCVKVTKDIKKRLGSSTDEEVVNNGDGWRCQLTNGHVATNDCRSERNMLRIEDSPLHHKSTESNWNTSSNDDFHHRFGLFFKRLSPFLFGRH